MNKKNIYARVVPLQRLPRIINDFDYKLNSDGNSSGDLVEFLFRKKIQRGIIVGLKNESTIVPERLQSITKTITHHLLTPLQLKFSHELSHYYGVSWSSTIQLCIPKLIKNFKLNTTDEPFKIKKHSTNQPPVVIAVGNSIDRLHTITNLIQRVLIRNRQVLLLVPEQNYVNEWIKIFNSDAAYVTSETTESEFRKIWQNTREGKIKLIIGTRRALFLPFNNLGGIIIEASENENYKQSEQNPRYYALKVAEHLSALTGASLAYVSSTPPLELWNLSQTKAYSWQNISNLPKKRLNFINFGEQKDKRSNSFLYPSTCDIVSQALLKQQRVLLYFNRLGNKMVICRECQFLPRCVICQRALVSTITDGKLKCYHCNSQTPYPLTCPRCGGINIATFGGGSDALANEIRNMWSKYNVVAMRSNTLPTTTLDQASIVIAGAVIKNLSKLSIFDIIVLVDPDIELGLPEFRATENAWHTYANMLVGGKSKIIVQTNIPNHYIWQSLKSGQRDIFYKMENLERVKYKYPPYLELCRFSAQDKNRALAYNLINNLYTDLKRLQLNNNFIILGPYPDYYTQVRGKYCYHILLKYLKNQFDPTTLWPHLPETVIIDRNPWNVLS